MQNIYNIRRTHEPAVKWSRILNFVVVNHSRSNIEVKLRLVDTLTYNFFTTHVLTLWWFVISYAILRLFFLLPKYLFCVLRIFSYIVKSLYAFCFSLPSNMRVSQSILVPLLFSVSFYKTMFLKGKHFCEITKKLLCLQ